MANQSNIREIREIISTNFQDIYLGSVFSGLVSDTGISKPLFGSEPVSVSSLVSVSNSGSDIFQPRMNPFGFRNYIFSPPPSRDFSDSCRNSLLD